MMKILKCVVAVFALGTALVACGNSAKNQSETKAKEEVEVKTEDPHAGHNHEDHSGHNH